MSQEDAQALLDGSIFKNAERPLSVVIDLRNADEIEKKKKTRTQAAKEFYQQIQTSPEYQLVHVPILKDVDAFWDEAVARMEFSDRLWATLQTVTSAGALDRAAARKMEDEGLSMLYTVTLATAQKRFRKVLQVCAEAQGPVIFHCQKGKDRTGLVAMLLQGCLGASHEEIVDTYAESGRLIGESTQSEGGGERSTETLIDWSKFRGSPSSAMTVTLAWIEQRHVSIESYIANELRLDGGIVEKLLTCRWIIK